MRKQAVSRHRTLLFAFVFNLLWLPFAVAQGGKGAIVGTVKDSSGASLQGALVELQPLARRVVSDEQGQFRFNEVAAGDYNVSSSYVGFSPVSISVKVEAGQTANVDAVLKVSSQADQVIVTAERLQGEAEAINIERTAENIVQVLPSKVINSLPNTNIADAVGRLPSVTLERDEGEGKYVQIRGTEPRLSNVTVNGIDVPSPEAGVRNIKLDVIPADLVDRIEVNKTLSADQDADAIGGSVNLVTRTPGDKPTYSFMGEGGYTPIQGGKGLNAFGGTIGRRFGVAKKLGVIFGGSYDYNTRGIDDLEPTTAVYGFNGVNVANFNALDYRTYSYYRSRYGFAGGIDYNIAPGSTAYIKGLFADFHNFGETWIYTPNAGSGLAAVNGNQLTYTPDGNMQYRHYLRRVAQQIYSFSAGARHDLASTLIVYDFAVSHSRSIGGFPTTYFSVLPSSPLNAIQFTQNLTNTLEPTLDPTAGTNIYDPTQYAISEVFLPGRHTGQFNIQGSISAAQRYNVRGHYGTFQLGTLIRNAHKNQLSGDKYYAPNASVNLLMAGLLGSYTNPEYYDHAYKMGPLTDYNKINQLLATNLPTNFSLEVDKTHFKSDPNTWDTTERVYAGYLMNSINIRKLRLQTGVRIEATDSSYSAFVVNHDPNNGKKYLSTTPSNGGSDYINVLPSVQAQYPLSPNTNLRASFGMGISRPNFQDLVPSQQVNPNNSPKDIQLGNPALKPTRAKNYDVLVEHFFQPLGILQAGFFYKDLTNPIYPTDVLLPPTDPLFPGYRRRQPINGPNAHITGIEAAWEQRFSFLPGLLSGFGVSANYSYTASRVDFPIGFSPAAPGQPGRIDHPSLPRQAPNTWNLGFTYDKTRFSMRFGVSHNDANIYVYNYVKDPAVSDNDPTLGLKGPLGDQYFYAHTQYDIQGSYRLYKGLQVVVAGLNLSNEVFGFYLGSPKYPIQREFYKPSAIAGLRWTTSSE